MKNFSFKRLTAWLLFFMMVISILPASAISASAVSFGNLFALDSLQNWFGLSAPETSTPATAAATSETTYILAGSDFQPTDGSTATGVNLMEAILDQIPNYEFDGFLFAGDYNYNYDESGCNSGRKAVDDTVTGKYPTITHEVYVQGNHDPDDMTGLSVSGANDPASGKYGVFVIHEKDYMWYNNDPDTIQTTANNLKSYLDAKVDSGYCNPIFVVSHLPLHYSLRTQVGGGDGKYAKYIFDVLQEAGEAGLNIIFLYGHNHSHGWDDPYGGASVYLQPGDNINIAKEGSTTEYTANALKFTYMNAGFVSYYRDVNEGACTHLTMTVFAITDNEVAISRYADGGRHNLKDAGVLNKSHQTGGSASCCSARGTETYAADTSVVQSDTLALTPVVADSTVSSANGDVTLTAPGVTSVNVTVDTSNPNPTSYSAYVKYDIVPVGYLGGEATVTVTLPTNAGFDSGRQVVVHDVAQNQNIAQATIVDGKVTFTASHFSAYEIMQLAETNATYSWTKIADATSGAAYYQLVTDGTIESGAKYLIVNAGSNGTAYALTSSGDRTQVTVANGRIDAVDANAVFTLTGGNGSYTILGTTGYLYPDATQYFEWWVRSVKTNQSTSRDVTFTSNGTAFGISRYITSNTTSYLSYNYRGFDASESQSNLYLYKEVTGEPTPAEYARLAGQNVFNYVVGKNVEDIYADIGTKIQVYTNTTDSDSSAGTLVTNLEEIAISTVDTTTAGTTSVQVSYKGKVIGTVTVTLTTKTAISITVTPMAGEIERGASVVPGATIQVTYDDGTTDTATLLTSYLSGTGLDINKNGTYENLTVTYAGLKLPGYTLTVKNVIGNNFPTYPNAGSIKLSKVVDDTLDFQKTGLARVNLSTSGLPANKGVDVVVVVDTSSSMNSSRLSALRTSINTLITTLKTPNKDGSLPDIDLAITEFNGYNFVDMDEYIVYRSGSGRSHSDIRGNVILDWVDINETQFVANESNITAKSGTNYDEAFERAYTMLSAKQEENGENKRDPYVVFLSDGAPFSYNYFVSNSSDTEGTRWNNWLQGTMTDTMLSEVSSNALNVVNEYYHPDGKHWMAEAIKGDPTQTYKVIRPGATTSNKVTYVNGLGATIYTVGLELEKDKQVTVKSMHAVLGSIASKDASGNNLYYTAGSAELETVFANIAGEVRVAATNAVFEDQMGEAFVLQLATSHGGQTTLDTSITITSQDIWTRDDLEKGDITDVDQIGKVKPNTEVTLETVTFNADGTEAYSSVLSGNILQNGVITANCFTYDTKTKTFRWDIGTINEKQYTLSYVVYLTNALGEDGVGRSAGSYATNDHATLSYINYLGNDVEQSVASPTISWQAAQVSYGFYLVDQQGNPLYANGVQAENFGLAYKVTQPVVYRSVNFNANATEIPAMEVYANAVKLDGYTLYDPNATYSVQAMSGNNGGRWTIGKGNDKIDSTYVTGFNATDYSKVTTSTNVDGYNYADTTVWFAVVWTIGTVPDTVVIDYGVPVKINVLANDMFGEKGKLVAVGKYDARFEDVVGGPTLGYVDDTPVWINVVPETGIIPENVDYVTSRGRFYPATYGKAAIEAGSGLVIYQPDSMNMDGAEKLTYAVNYANTSTPSYYYGTLTIIPATSIYFEESFVTFNNAKDANGAVIESGNGTWTSVGSGSAGNSNQAEDRPGEYSLPEVDANHVYGYDDIYATSTEYSLGAAQQVTVTPEMSTAKVKEWPTATFTFTGTGFDIVSLTNNQSGAIAVKVDDAAGNTVKQTSVDLYYGYTYDANTGWEVDPDSKDTLYQIPVIKVADLQYGTYTVTIEVMYIRLFDHSETKDGYNFVLDSIRIYDPVEPDAEGNDIIKDAYVADGEYNPTYKLIKSEILNGPDVTDKTQSELSGVVFIDGINGTSNPFQYGNPGPNNEVYLAGGQSIAFKMQVNFNPDKTMIGVKLATGNGAEMTLKLQKEGYNKPYYTGTKLFNTATDMYYPIESIEWTKNGENTWISPTLTLTNTNTDSDFENIVSLTNIKITEKVESAGGSVATQSADDTYGIATVSMMSLLADEPNTITFVTDAEVLRHAYALAYPAFEPAFIKYKVKSIGFGRFASTSVLVVTSNDVASLTLNGKALEKITKVTRDITRFDSKWVLEKEFGVDLDSGEYSMWLYSAFEKTDYEIVAYHADGTASKPISTTDDAYSAGSLLGDIIGGIFDKVEEAKKKFEETETYKLMKALSERYFNPEQFKTKVTKFADAGKQLIVEASEDVEYIIADGEIVKKYITETVIDFANNGKKTVKRVFVADVAEDGAVDVAAYDENGVASAAQTAED